MAVTAKRSAAGAQDATGSGTTPTAAPTRKVTSAAVAGAITTVAVYIYQQSTGETLPNELVAAITTLVTALVAYIVPPGDNEAVIPTR